MPLEWHFHSGLAWPWEHGGEEGAGGVGIVDGVAITFTSIIITTSIETRISTAVIALISGVGIVRTSAGGTVTSGETGHPHYRLAAGTWATTGSITHNIVAVPHTGTAQPLTGSAAFLGEIRWQTVKRTLASNFDNRAITSPATEQVEAMRTTELEEGTSVVEAGQELAEETALETEISRVEVLETGTPSEVPADITVQALAPTATVAHRAWDLAAEAGAAEEGLEEEEEEAVEGVVVAADADKPTVL
jgi:hypothetical protein